MNLMHVQPFKVADARKVMIIDVSNNRLMSAASLGQFKHLQSLNIAFNRLSSIESILFSLPKDHLVSLCLRGNPIKEDAGICANLVR